MHTPGPWTHDPEVTDPDTLNTAPEVSATLPNGDTRYICRMFGTAPQVIEESQSNARLIAAAPDMLKALQETLSHITPRNPAYDIIRNAIHNATNYATATHQEPTPCT